LPKTGHLLIISPSLFLMHVIRLFMVMMVKL
jgi:hypothetical protein